jgi:hypothetical protein
MNGLLHNSAALAPGINFPYLYLLTPWSTVLETLTRSQSRNSPHFMEPEGSLPHLQVPATFP